MKKVTIDGVPFLLTTESEGGYYYGKWTCLIDMDTGESDKRCGSEEEALKMARNNAQGHAGMVHGEGSE